MLSERLGVTRTKIYKWNWDRKKKQLGELEVGEVVGGAAPNNSEDEDDDEEESLDEEAGDCEPNESGSGQPGNE